MSFNSRSTKGALRLLGAVGLAGSILAGSAISAQAATGVQRPDWAALFVAQINTDRAMYHHRTLTVTYALTMSAQRWAASMARSDTLAHNPHLATSVTGWKYLGENVGVGYGIGLLKHAFWQSAGHRANMLDPDFTQVGVAVVYVGSKVWVAEEFGRPLSGATIRAASTTSSVRVVSALLPAQASAPSATMVPVFAGRSLLSETMRPPGLMAPSRTTPGSVLGGYSSWPGTQILS
jgi:Cysteine-rich secretory protein family